MKYIKKKISAICLKDLINYLSVIQDKNVKGMLSWDKISKYFQENMGKENEELYQQILTGAIQCDKERFNSKQKSLKKNVGNNVKMRNFNQIKFFECEEVNKMFVEVNSKWTKYSKNLTEDDRKSHYIELEKRLMKYSKNSSEKLTAFVTSENQSIRTDCLSIKTNARDTVQASVDHGGVHFDTGNGFTAGKITEVPKTAEHLTLTNQTALSSYEKGVVYGFQEIFEKLSKKTKNPFKDVENDVSVQDLKDKRITCPVPFSFLQRQEVKRPTIRQKNLENYKRDQEKKMRLIGKATHKKTSVPRNLRKSFFKSSRTNQSRVKEAKRNSVNLPKAWVRKPKAKTNRVSVPVKKSQHPQYSELDKQNSLSHYKQGKKETSKPEPKKNKSKKLEKLIKRVSN